MPQKKTNKKQKKTPTKARKQPKQVVPASKKVSSIAPKRVLKLNHHTSVCSITDPFCIHARGAQRPDGGPPSIPFQVRLVHTMTANFTHGAQRSVFLANPLYQILHSQSLTAGVWNMGDAFVSLGGNAFISANAKELRINSFGCIVRSAMTATTAKGLVILSSEPSPNVDSNHPQGSMDSSESVVVTLAAGMEHAWVSKPLGPSAHMFRPVGDYTNTMTNFDWTSLVVEVSGSDTTSAIPFLTVEYVLNLEMTLSAGDALGNAQLQRAPPALNRAVLAASAHSHASRPSFIEGGISAATSFLEKKASSALETILSDGLAFLGL